MKLYTKDERKATAIAKKLGNALLAIEEFKNDPSMIFDDVNIYLCSPELAERYSKKGTEAAIKTLREHYESPTEVKKLVAEQRMKEFDPECERHYPLLIVKAVDPGCTVELQIEIATTGEVSRLTSTDNDSGDQIVFEKAVCLALRRAWNTLKIGGNR